MASLLKAIRKYGPRLDLAPVAQTEDVLEWMAQRSRLLRKSLVSMVMRELGEAILEFNSQGIPLKLPGIGTFSPSIDRYGKLKINYRADAALKKRSNAQDAYRGKIVNKDRIGLDNAGYKEIWDAIHPSDPLKV